MNKNFYGQKLTFLDKNNNKILGKNLNAFQTQKFSKSFYKTNEEKESSDFVLQKMQLSLNNFLSNLKKSENIDQLEDTDSYTFQNQYNSLEIERPLNFINANFNKNNIENNIVFNNYQDSKEGFPRGKEKSESHLNTKNLKKNSNKYYKSPYVKDINQKEGPNSINPIHSFYRPHHKINNINKNIDNSIDKNIDNNNYDTSGIQRTNMDISLPLKVDRNKNIILINENSSYSSEENKNNNLNSKTNDNNKNKDPISIINNVDNENDYKKLVQKIKEKKAEKEKEKEIVKNNILNQMNNNIDNKNDLNLTNEQKLQLINNEILLDSNNKKKSKKDLKEPFSKKYVDNNEELCSNSTVLKRKKNFLDGNVIKKEYSDEKDNDMKMNYRKTKRSNEGIYIPREILDNNNNNNNNNNIPKKK